MSATLVRDPATEPPTGPPRSEEAARRPDGWPHTSRPMPWLIALFVAMLYLLPVDAILLPINLPFNSGLDRILLVIVLVVWLALSLTGNDRPAFKHTPTNVAIYAFVVLSAVSVVLNLRDLTWDGEMSLSFKQLVLGMTYVLFYFVAASSLRREDIVGFVKFFVGLAALSAIGTILQYRTHHNIFADLAHLIPGAKVGVGNGPGKALLPGARVSYAGPTKHGLSDATLLNAALPFALVLLSRATTTALRVRYGLALLLLIAGCVSTQEKTAIILMVVSVAITVAYRPRRYARYWPLAIVAVFAVRFAAPHSISALIYQFRVLGTSNSTSGRSSDYPAVSPFIITHLLFGRGFGSFDPHKYRILDNQLLGFLITIGSLGVLSYGALILTPAATVHRVARHGPRLEDEAMVAVIAGCVAYLVSNFLYDTFSFRQGPYIFFLLAALAAARVGTTTAAATPRAPPDPTAAGLTDA